MKKGKLLLVLALSVLALATFVGCGNNNKTTENNKN